MSRAGCQGSLCWPGAKSLIFELKIDHPSAKSSPWGSISSEIFGILTIFIKASPQYENHVQWQKSTLSQWSLNSHPSAVSGIFWAAQGPDPCRAEWSRQLQMATQDGRTHPALLCADLPQGDSSSPCPPALSLPGRWSSAGSTRENSCLSSSFCKHSLAPSLKRGAECLRPWKQTGRSGEQCYMQLVMGQCYMAHVMALPSASVAASQGTDEDRIVFPCQSALALLRDKSWLLPTGCKKMYKVTERGKWRQKVLSHPQSSVTLITQVPSETFCPAETHTSVILRRWFCMCCYEPLRHFCKQHGEACVESCLDIANRKKLKTIRFFPLELQQCSQ